VAASLVSVLIALLIYMIVITPVNGLVGDTPVLDGQKRITEDYLLPYIFWPALGLITGLTRYFLIRRYLPRVISWIYVTTMAWPLALYGIRVLYLNLAGTIHPTIFGVMRAILTGGVIGITQWLVLHQKVPWSGLWIVFTIAGCGLGAGFSNYMDLWVMAPPALTTAAAWYFLLDYFPGRVLPGEELVQVPDLHRW
jgi:hypothetical protein